MKTYISVNPKTQQPVITVSGDFFRTVNQSWLTTKDAYLLINRNMAGEPTKLAVELGVVPETWPYRLYDETNIEMRDRLEAAK